MSDAIRQEIEKEVAEHEIVVYGKGTKDMPRCGFTLETIEFFNRFGYPFAVIDVLENVPKRTTLSEMTDWPTLPKVFIGGKFYGDTDILGPMLEQGELQPILDETFAGKQPSPVVKLH
jgi:monothiol glutaredoxin